MPSIDQDAPTVAASSLANQAGASLSDPTTQGLTPYDAAAYFAPSYFYGGSNLTPATQGLTPYYAATYFAPAYFYGGPITSAPAGVPQPTGRDSSYYSALISLLETIDLFDAVIFGDPTSGSAAGANTHPLAIVTPKGWEETDETDPVLWVRRVSFTIRIIIQVDGALAPFDQLDQLATAVQSQVDQANLGGQSLAALTRIRAGRYGTSSTYPEWSIDLDGEFTVLIDSQADPIVS